MKPPLRALERLAFMSSIGASSRIFRWMKGPEYLSKKIIRKSSTWGIICAAPVSGAQVRHPERVLEQAQVLEQDEVRRREDVAGVAAHGDDAGHVAVRVDLELDVARVLRFKLLQADLAGEAATMLAPPNFFVDAPAIEQAAGEDRPNQFG